MCGLVTFTEEILNGKLHFLCSDSCASYDLNHTDWFLLLTKNCVRFRFGPLLELSFQIHPDSRFLKISFNQVWSGSFMAATLRLIVWWQYGTFNVSGNCAPADAILDMRDTS